MATSAAGTELAISTRLPSVPGLPGYAALTYVAIGGVEKIGTYGASVSKVAFQTLKRRKQKYKGSVDYGALQPTIALDSTDAGQRLLQAAGDDETQKLYAFCVTYPDGSKRYFKGRVFGMPENVDGADSMLIAAPAIEILTAIVKATAAEPLPPGYEFLTTNGGADFVTTQGGAERVTIKVI